MTPNTRCAAPPRTPHDPAPSHSPTPRPPRSPRTDRRGSSRWRSPALPLPFSSLSKYSVLEGNPSHPALLWSPPPPAAALAHTAPFPLPPPPCYLRSLGHSRLRHAATGPWPPRRRASP